MRAHCLIRTQPWYRHSAFIAGLQAAGHSVETTEPTRPDRDTLLVIWNRYQHWHEIANRVEKAGGTVIVAENGYLSAGGGVPKFDVHPKGPKPGDYYALAIGGHNGSGGWRSESSGDRWQKLNVGLKPLRTSGSIILICPSRHFGRPDMTMPAAWDSITFEQLRRQTNRHIKIRQHPGNDVPARPLSEDLKDAYAVVIWASSSGLHALIEGIPVICHAPYWIAKEAACSSLEEVERLDADAWDWRRLRAMHRLAWAQWTVKEIESGEPFRNLLRATGQEKVSASA